MGGNTSNHLLLTLRFKYSANRQLQFFKKEYFRRAQQQKQQSKQLQELIHQQEHRKIKQKLFESILSELWENSPRLSAIKSALNQKKWKRHVVFLLASAPPLHGLIAALKVAYFPAQGPCLWFHKKQTDITLK